MELIKENDNIYTFEVYDNKGNVKEITHIEASSESEAKDIILNRPKPDKLKNAKNRKIREIKSRCERLIESETWRVERFDLEQREGIETTESKTDINTLIKTLNGYRAKNNAMESEILKLTTVKKIENYKIDFNTP